MEKLRNTTGRNIMWGVFKAREVSFLVLILVFNMQLEQG